MFDGSFQVFDRRIVGEDHLKLLLCPQGGNPIDAIGFRLARHLEGIGDGVHLAYRLEVNEYRGEVSPQLIVEHLECTSQRT
jgi:single-stranded-DNA-specific exonuclease